MPFMELWHGTNESFERFDTSLSLGVHFGTLEAAQQRLQTTGRTQDDQGRAATPRSYRVSIERAVVLEDLGTWSFAAVARELRAHRVLSAAQIDAAYGEWNQSDIAGWAALKAALREAGFDGVVYRNAVEDKGADSWIAFEAEQIEPVPVDVQRMR